MLHSTGRLSTSSRPGRSSSVPPFVQALPFLCPFQACAKWRKMPPGYRADDPRFSGDWYCDMNPNREMAAYGCDAPQEVDEVTA
jgi:CW-type Zinc Finger